MRIGLASYKFINNDVEYNISQIEKALSKANNVDLLCFGEAFLQGFDAFNWDYNNDLKIAISNNSNIIKRLEKLSEKFNIDLAFGYLERENENLYSSYVIIIDGVLTFNYRRISVGWKEYTKTDHHYKEGNEVLNFNYKGEIFTVALCGDLWEYPEKFKTKGILLWPVYVNYTPDEWSIEKIEYAKQALIASKDTLMINSLSVCPNCYGGCFYFKDGNIANELGFNKEGILTIEFNK